MAKRKRKYEPLDTIWEVDDKLWAVIQPVLAEFDPSASTGRRRTGQREALNGIIYRMRSGVQWNHLPKQFGDDSSVHRTMQRWEKKGVFEKVWVVLIEACDDLDGVNWEWQSVDGSMGKARMGGDKIGPNPTDRAKNGQKKAFSSRPRADRWRPSSPGRMCMTPSC